MVARLWRLWDEARGAWWAVGAWREVRRALVEHGLTGVVITPPLRLPARAERGMRLVMDRVRPSCLERALILQAWHQAHGHDHDVIIGVAWTEAEFRAHAWLDVETASQGAGFREITRISP